MSDKALTTTAPAGAPGAQLAAGSEAMGYARASKATNTRRAYQAAWADFTAFCAERGAVALPAAPGLVADWLASLAGRGLNPRTIDVKRAGVRFAHRAAGLDDPTAAEVVRATLAGIRRSLGRAPVQKAPVTLDELRAMVGALPRVAGALTLAGIRDRALLLVGMAGAFRRSELVALDVADLRFTADGVTATVKRSKTDQEGQGLAKPIPYLVDVELCPTRALRAWLDAAGIHSGPVFRPLDRGGHAIARRLSDRAAALIVKAAALGAGLDPRQFAGHSLRAGFVTEAARAGVPEWAIMEVTGHKSRAMVDTYIRNAGLSQRAAVRRTFGE